MAEFYNCEEDPNFGNSFQAYPVRSGMPFPSFPEMNSDNHVQVLVLYERAENSAHKSSAGKMSWLGSFIDQQSLIHMPGKTTMLTKMDRRQIVRGAYRDTKELANLDKPPSSREEGTKQPLWQRFAIISGQVIGLSIPTNRTVM